MLTQSEEKYRGLIENIQDGIFIIQDAKLNFVNEAFARIAGYPIQEIIGMDFRDLVAQEDKELVVDRYTRRLRGEKVPSEYEFRLIRKDGTIVAVDMNVGAFTYFGRIASIGILKDITQRKLLDETLRQSEERYRTLVDWTPEAIVVHRGGKLIYVNPAAIKLIGAKSVKDLIGKPLLDLVHPDFRQIVLERTKNIIEKGIYPPMIEEKFIKLDGTTIDVEVKATSIIYDGELANFAAIHDITQSKRAKKGMEEAIIIAQSEKNKSEAIIAALGDGIIIQDTDYLIT
jgi:PAS domain S-box-containing protein